MVVQRDGMGLVPTREPGERTVAALYTLLGADGLRVQLCSYGARVVSVVQPDRKGVLEEVVLGFETVNEYTAHRDFFWGAVLGRVAGRLINSECLCLDELMKLLPNLGMDHYNGGQIGFDNVVWESSVEGEDEVVFSLVSEAPDEGYGAGVLVQASYSLADGCELRLRLSATCTAPTPVALAHSIPVNLAGHASGKTGLLQHNLAINATKYFVTDQNQYFTGEVRSVEDTTLDFRTRRLLKKWHSRVPMGGLCHTLAYTEAVEHGPHFVARLHHEPTGRCVEVRSDLPCVHVDTMRWLPPSPDPVEEVFIPDLAKRKRKWPTWMPRPQPDSPELATYRAMPLYPDCPPDRWFMKFPSKTARDSPPIRDSVPPVTPRKDVHGRGGTFYWRHGGIILQPQHFPDTIDHQYLPTYALKPGEIYTQNIWYRFFCKKDDDANQPIEEIIEVEMKGEDDEDDDLKDLYEEDESNED